MGEDLDAKILIDTREQRPYSFAGAKIVTLKTGDYSVEGLADRVAIERKSVIDAFGSVGKSRGRFEREVSRLGDLDFGAIVVEGDMREMLRNPPSHSAMQPKSVLCTLLAWSVKYGVHVYFASDRAHGAATVRNLLRYARKYLGK